MSNQNPIEYIHQETVVIHSGYRSDPTTGAVAVPIYQTASYQFESTKDAENLFALSELGDIYTRIMNPTCHVLKKGSRCWTVVLEPWRSPGVKRRHSLYRISLGQEIMS